MTTRSINFLETKPPARGVITCPKCRGPVRESAPGVQPRRKCVDPSCVFQHGWRLEFDNPTSTNMIAVPFDSDGHQLVNEAVVWPPRSGRNYQNHAT